MKKQHRSRIISTVLLILLSASLLLNAFFFFHYWNQNIVTSVPDGDSLQLASGQRIRLLGIDAPERDSCMAHEARMLLEQSAKGKHLTLKDTITDDYGRTLANVFISQFPELAGFKFQESSFLNHLMVSRGFAKFIYVKSPYSETLRIAQSISKANKVGIWSETCRKTSNPDCDIKGNTRGVQKTYHLPDCKNYDQTIIDTAFGDVWFCSEKEAIASSFSRASGCK